MSSKRDVKKEKVKLGAVMLNDVDRSGSLRPFWKKVRKRGTEILAHLTPAP